MTEYIVNYAGFTSINGKREEIVRCRDCKYIFETDSPMTTSGYWCAENSRPADPNGFCDCAERRNDPGDDR